MAKKRVVAIEMSAADLGPRTEQAKALDMASDYYQKYVKVLAELSKLKGANDSIPALKKEIKELKKRIEELNQYDRSNLLDFD